MSCQSEYTKRKMGDPPRVRRKGRLAFAAFLPDDLSGLVTHIRKGDRLSRGIEFRIDSTHLYPPIEEIHCFALLMAYLRGHAGLQTVGILIDNQCYHGIAE